MKSNLDYKNKFNYVIYHRKCLDGFTGLFLLYKTKLIDRNATIYADVPSSNVVPPNIKNKNVIIIDVAYKYEIVHEIVSQAESVLFIDHHETIHDDVQKIKNNKTIGSKLEIVYDINKSGATLVWDYFYNTPPPLFVRYIEDNDIGKWKLDYVHEFIIALQVLYKLDANIDNFKNWDKLFLKEQIQKLIIRGRIYLELTNKQVKDNAPRVSIEAFPSVQFYDKYSEYFKKPAQYKVAVYCGTPCSSAADLSKKVFEEYECDFFISWVYLFEKKEYVLTFRSKTVDVGNIAKIFGGGGHKLAAACSFKSSLFHITDLFYEQSLQRSKIKKN